MTTNPFVSKIFTSVWLKYFSKGKETYTFNFINSVKFLKHKRLPYYTNVGKNITNGMFYSFSNLNLNKDYKGKVFLLYDVPTYFNIDNTAEGSTLRIKKIKQYNGFLTNLSNYESFDEFFTSHYKSKTRYNLRKKHKSLISCFNTHFTFHYGKTSKDDYNEIMDSFKMLIGKRFGELGLANNALSKWDYYKELFYSMVENKQALILGMYRDDVLISGAMCFLSDDVLFYAIPTFDADYYDFNLGHETITELYKWCFDNNVKTFDFSKGEYDYKKRWANKEYDFECHVLYDSKSIKSYLFANFVSGFFGFKQFLRDQNINLLYKKIKFYFKGKTDNIQSSYNLEVFENDLDFEFIDDFIDDKYNFLRPSVFKYLYKNPELVNNLKIYKGISNNTEVYYVKGEKTKLKITTK